MNDPPTSESSAAPAFLKLLISTAPGVSCSNHHKPNHPELTSPIADLGVHPALEAALHLANGDLYSAHFLVRKAQGGAKEIDWGHAILHRLEGDWGNSKCWYTDLDNVASSRIYADFWRKVPKAHEDMTACKFVDLCAIHSAPQATAEKIHESSAKYDKIKSAYSLSELERFKSNGGPPMSLEQTNELAREELAAMIKGLANVHGWRKLDQTESVEAFKEQSTSQDGSRVEHDAQGMIMGGGARRF